MLKLVIASALILNFASGQLAAAKKHNWQSAELTKVFEASIYTIEGNGYRYEVQYSPPITLSTKQQRVPNVTVGGSVKYALDDGIFYILDEDARVFTFNLLKKEFFDKTVDIIQVRQYAKERSLSEADAIKKYRDFGFSITGIPPAPPVKQ